MPMVEAVIAKRNLLMSFDRESDGHRSFSPELNMVAAIIFILNLHYAFDHPRRVGYLDSILCKWMVPSSRDLLAQWRALPDRSDLKFRHLPAQGELPWDQLDSYLTFCEQLGMTLPSSGEGEDDEQQQGPKQWQHHHFDQIAIPRPSPDYPVGPTDPEVLTGLLHDLRRSKKIWTLIEVDTIERLPSAYRALLEAVSGLLDWNDPLELLRRTNRVFYQK